MELARFAKCAGLVSASVGRMICIFWQWESLGRNADANADLTDDPARIKWREFYELPRYGMVGAFEGAYMYARGIWRPETNSCMNNNVSYFNAPSRKKIVKRIMELSGRSFDMNDFLAKDAINLSTSARSRLREPRAGELFVPFAPPVLTVGNSSAKSFCRLEHVAGEVPFFAIFYGLPAFCRADPLGAAGGDGDTRRYLREDLSVPGKTTERTDNFAVRVHGTAKVFLPS